jgi:hypothetical protein
MSAMIIRSSSGTNPSLGPDLHKDVIAFVRDSIITPYLCSYPPI